MRLLQSPAVQPELHPQHGDAYDPGGTRNRTCRDQTTHDNVLFQAAQFIAFARNGCFGQHASGPWNDAAEMKDSVARDALVIPSRSRE